MADAVLFTQADPRMGPAATNLFRVKGLEALVVTVDDTEWEYHGPLSVGCGRNPVQIPGSCFIAAATHQST